MKKIYFLEKSFDENKKLPSKEFDVFFLKTVYQKNVRNNHLKKIYDDPYYSIREDSYKNSDESSHEQLIRFFHFRLVSACGDEFYSSEN